jgi:tyrosyl-tRNA synthetase
MGRSLQKTMGQEVQAALFMPILEGLDGVEKMSKSLQNHIGINEPAEVMFKKIMEVPDHLIIRYYELATDEHPDEILKIKLELTAGKNPRDIKFRLAQIITGLYYSEEEVEKAVSYYETAFRKKSIPDEIPTLLLAIGKETVSDTIPQLVAMGLVKSRSEFIRLMKQGGIRLNGEKIVEEDLNTVLFNFDVLKIGKKVFVRIDK